MKTALLILFLFASTGCARKQIYDSRLISPRILTVIASIEKDSIIEGPYVGYGGTPSLQYEKYLVIKRDALRSDLILLLYHPNPVIRAIAFRALVSTDCPECAAYLIKSSAESKPVSYMSYDLVMESYFADALLQIWLEPGSFFGDPSRRKIAKHIFSHNPNIRIKSAVLAGLHPDNDYYEDIKRSLFANKEYSLLIPLAKYNYSEDVPIFLQYLKNLERASQSYLFIALEHYRLPEFLAEFKKISLQLCQNPELVDRNNMKQLYKNIAGYGKILATPVFAEVLEELARIGKKDLKENESAYIEMVSAILNIAKENHLFSHAEIESKRDLVIKRIARAF